MKKLLLVAFLLAVTIGVALLSGVAATPGNGNGNSPFEGCPEDAYLCDDGTIVYRVPPSCHFEKCPK